MLNIGRRMAISLIR